MGLRDWVKKHFYIFTVSNRFNAVNQVAIINIAKKKGGKFIGENDFAFNFIIVKRNLVANTLSEVSTESILTHFSLQKSYKQFNEVKDLKFIEG